YSFQDTKTPVKTAAASMLLHVILCLLLMYPMGISGLALATAISSYLNLAILAYILRKKIGALGIHKIIKTILKTAASAALSSISAYFLCRELPLNIYLSVFISIFAAVFIFITASKILKSEELEICLNALKRQLKAKN
ncbi:MAG: polysaccharide biosynthesis C-terminal domain-containing protein, partial [Elusimicrobiota bacterium]|nr:polysaccharide biosynthesis C-terminal domain-containing protein [Elusimicrobiota bacterium]